MTCPHCGAKIGTPSDTCPACLQPLGLAFASDAPTVSATQAQVEARAREPRLSTGHRFGPYRIERLLGRGGMGEVYEAEHVKHDRRVAIKVLNQTLTNPKDRARFLREGQLAASISHPNTVYIFGSEEVDGTPVIAMELLPAGTLKDRVREQGPLPYAEAVDAILQVVAGLDAAQAGGILHRDIKPSNCFVDRDGTVKVGDFGLSISTMARDVTQLSVTGTFHGTPQFAPPEQLKGEPLDMRADIYAVGATLNYLLTGKPPFDTGDLMALVARVATEPPQSPRVLSPKVPRGLAALVLRCLAKDPARRPDSHAALARELRPFSSEAATPATLGLRLLAGLLDVVTVFPLAIPVLYVTFQPDADIQLLPWFTVTQQGLVLCYYGLLEGSWSRTLGKRMCGLRVTRSAGQPAGFARAFGRAALFMAAGVPYLTMMFLMGPERLLRAQAESDWVALAGSWSALAMLALLFSTVRRRNGFAGLHGLATDTRVVRDLPAEVSAVWTAAEAPVDDAAGLPSRFGPFDVTGRVGPTDVGELLVGFDPTLRRKVWIHVVPAGTAALTPLRRDVGRPGRLRWLGGHRDADEAWDAFDAPDGRALSDLGIGGGSESWGRVKRWLADLARETDAGLADGTLPVLALDRIWITRDDRAKLLDFGAQGTPDSQPVPAPVTVASTQVFLADVARRALGVPAVSNSVGASASGPPIPLSARRVIVSLEQSGFATLTDVATTIRRSLGQPDRVTRLRRALTMGLFCLVPALALAFLTLSLFIISLAASPDHFALVRALSRLEGRIERSAEEPSNEQHRRERQAVEAFVSARFGTMIADENTWTNPFLAGLLLPQRAIAEGALVNYSNVSDADLTALRSEHPTLMSELEEPPVIPQLSLAFLASAADEALVGMTILYAIYAVGGLITAVLFRVGFTLRLFRVAIVTGAGTEASRGRTLFRSVVAWSPLVVLFFARQASIAGLFEPGRAALAGLLLAVGVTWAIARPARGLQDRIAGTWLVPR